MRPARDLLLLIACGAVSFYGARALLSPPALGPPRPAERCPAPVEVPGEGVACGGAPGLRARPMSAHRRLALGVPLDVNRATVEELTALTGVGPHLARAIARARPFRSPEDLLRVRGIGRTRLARLRAEVAINPPD